MRQICLPEYIRSTILREDLGIINGRAEIFPPGLGKILIVIWKVIARRNKLPVDESDIIYHVVSYERFPSVHQYFNDSRKS